MDIANEDNNSTDADYVPDEDDADTDSETDIHKKSILSTPIQNLHDDDEKQNDISKDKDNDSDSDDDDDAEATSGGNRLIKEEEKWKRSLIWNYFVDVNKEARTATCCLCFKEYSFRGGIGNLKCHVKRKHKIHLTLRKQWSENLALANRQNLRHKRSEVWNYFEDIDSKAKRAKCNLCDGEFSYWATTGSLKKHLNRRHAIVLEKKPNSESENYAPNEDNKRLAEQKTRRRSDVWKQFTVIDEIERLATCNICDQKLCYTTSTNLNKHLYRMHGRLENIKDLNKGEVKKGYYRSRSDLKQPKRYSTIWNLFDVTNEETRTAACRVCKKEFSFWTTIGNLKKHIKNIHSWVTLDQPYMEDEEGEAEIAEEQTSPVWAYFKCLSKDLKLALCLICKKRLEYNDEQDLSKHLGRKHPRVLNELESPKPKKLMITGDGDIYEIDDNVAKQEPTTRKDQDTDSESWPDNNDEADAMDNSEYLDETIFTETKPSPAKKLRFTPDRRPSKTQPVTTTKTTQPVRKSILIDNRRNSSQEDEDNSLQLFGKYMISLLKKLPKHESDKLQLDFIRQIMETQINSCQNTSNVNNSTQNSRSSLSVINIRSPQSIDDAITSNSDMQRVITSDGEIRQLVVENEIIVSGSGN